MGADLLSLLHPLPQEGNRNFAQLEAQYGGPSVVSPPPAAAPANAPAPPLALDANAATAALAPSQEALQTAAAQLASVPHLQPLLRQLLSQQPNGQFQQLRAAAAGAGGGAGLLHPHAAQLAAAGLLGVSSPGSSAAAAAAGQLGGAMQAPSSTNAAQSAAAQQLLLSAGIRPKMQYSQAFVLAPNGQVQLARIAVANGTNAQQLQYIQAQNQLQAQAAAQQQMSQAQRQQPQIVARKPRTDHYISTMGQPPQQEPVKRGPGNPGKRKAAGSLMEQVGPPHRCTMQHSSFLKLQQLCCGAQAPLAYFVLC